MFLGSRSRCSLGVCSTMLFACSVGVDFFESLSVLARRCSRFAQFSEFAFGSFLCRCSRDCPFSEFFLSFFEHRGQLHILGPDTRGGVKDIRCRIEWFAVLIPAPYSALRCTQFFAIIRCAPCRALKPTRALIILGTSLGMSDLLLLLLCLVPLLPGTLSSRPPPPPGPRSFFRSSSPPSVPFLS